MLRGNSSSFLTPIRKFHYLRSMDDLERQLADKRHDKNYNFTVKLNEQVIQNANIALRTAVLDNGAAAIAMLSFISSLYGKDPNASNRDYASLTAPLMWFAVGVAMGAFAIAMSYFTNYSIVANAVHKLQDYNHPYIHDTPLSKRWLRAAITCQIIAIVAGLGSLGTFVYGMLQIKHALTTFL